MKDKNNPRISISASLLFFYLVPVFIFSWYAVQTASLEISWHILTTGIIGSVVCSLILAFWLIYWEKKMFSMQGQSQPLNIATEGPLATSTSEEIQNYQAKVENLEQQINEFQLLTQELKDTLESKESEFQLSNQDRNEVSKELENFRRFADEQISEKERQRIDLERFSADLKSELEKKQSQSHQLESKIRDLSYEVKTLLQLADMNTNSSLSENEVDFLKKMPEVKTIGYAVHETPSRYSISTEESEAEQNQNDKYIQSESDGSLQLKRYIDFAQKMTGAHYFAQGNRYGDLGGDPYALDLRRLFDHLRNEGQCVVFVYSQREHKMLFCNNQAKQILGWTPEKIVLDFNALIMPSMDEWKNALVQATTRSEVTTNLIFKTKDNNELKVSCQLGAIPSGLFKGHLIGIAYVPALV